MNLHENAVRIVGERLEDVKAQIEALISKAGDAERMNSTDRRQLKLTYDQLKISVRGEAHHLSLCTVSRELNPIERDFLLPALRTAAAAMVTPVSSPASKWVVDLQQAGAAIRNAISVLERTFPDSLGTAVDRLQRELRVNCRTKSHSRSKLLNALVRMRDYLRADRFRALFNELYDSSGSPVSLAYDERRLDIAREDEALSELSMIEQVV